MAGLSKTLRLGILAVILIGLSAYAGSKYQEYRSSRIINEHRYFDSAVETKWLLFFLEKLEQEKEGEAVCYLRKLMETNVAIMRGYAEDANATHYHESFVTENLAAARNYLNEQESGNSAVDCEAIEEMVLEKDSYLK